MKRVSERCKQLQFERLEDRLPLSANDLLIATERDIALTRAPEEPAASAATEQDVKEVAEAALAGPFWADQRGVYLFHSNGYHGVWAPREWTLAQWEVWLDSMQFLGLNHLQLPRAPWSERPGATPFELDKEALWVSVLQSAKARGMTTSLIFGSTWHGVPGIPWRVLSPGNSPADPNWQQLVSGYQYWANRFGPWVDEWLMGVEDPGGSPSSAGISYPFETPSPLGAPSRVAELVSLELEMRAAAQAVNPASRVVAETWGLGWWGLTPGYPNHLAEFLANLPRLPPDVTLSTNAFDDTMTDALQATGRDVAAWPFFLIDHEFPNGHTKLHFQWTRDYLLKIRNQGIDDVVAHITHPTEQLPSLYIYARLLQDPTLSKLTLLNEFASLLVSDPGDQASLANAISNLGLFWESVSGIANWDPGVLQPTQATAPYAPRYNVVQRTRLDSALAAINAVNTPRSVALIPMQVTPATWVEMLREQIRFLHDAAYMERLVTESKNHLNAGHPAVAAFPEPLSRTSAEAIAEARRVAGAAGALQRMESYLGQFWSETTGQNHPLGIIYDFLRTNIDVGDVGIAELSGDYLEYDAPGFDPLFKQLDGRIEESDPSFSYQQNAAWIVDKVSGAFSGGSAMRTSTLNNEVNIIFSGTGVSLIHSIWEQGAVASWSINGGAGGSGTLSMNAAQRQDQVASVLATGLPQTLHVLTLKKAGGTAGQSILVDGIIVENNNRLRREEHREPFSFAGPWVATDLGTPSGGSWQYTTSNAASVTVEFTGTAVALAATTRADYGVLAWSIDGGVGGSGTVNLLSPHNTSRKPFILTTQLDNGPHTLTLTKQSGFLVNIDAIDSAIETTGDFDANGFVDGRDLLAWQRGFGVAAPAVVRGQGDGDRDRDVDGADFKIWESRFGDRTPFGAAAAIGGEAQSRAVALGDLAGAASAYALWHEATDDSHQDRLDAAAEYALAAAPAAAPVLPGEPQQAAEDARRAWRPGRRRHWSLPTHASFGIPLEATDVWQRVQAEPQRLADIPRSHRPDVAPPRSGRA